MHVDREKVIMAGWYVLLFNFADYSMAQCVKMKSLQEATCKFISTYKEEGMCAHIAEHAVI